jgi:nucleoside-diphosphate-sugar epimerase
MNVLVTGHHGYIGSVLVPVLQEYGHRVTGLDNYLYEGCDLFESPVSIPESNLDVRDLTPRDLEGFDAVVHLAALSNDPLGALDERLTMEINYEATVALARAARTAGVSRFVFASSCSMYGASDGPAPVDETATQRPFTAYAESKVRSEQEIVRLADADFSPVFMRNATVYGVSPRLRVDLVLNNLVGWAYTTGSVRIMSDGTPWRPLVHVEDVAHAAAAILDAPREVVHAEAFNVGRDDENYQVRDLAEIARETVPNAVVEYAGSGDPDPRSYRVSFAKLRSALPELVLRWDARKGSEQLLNAYRRAQLTHDVFIGDRFTRLKRLEHLLTAGKLDRSLRRGSANRKGDTLAR